LIVVPSVALDRQMNRLGHGKGYYDNFIQRCNFRAETMGIKPPALSISLFLLCEFNWPSCFGVEVSNGGEWKNCYVFKGL